MGDARLENRESLSDLKCRPSVEKLSDPEVARYLGELPGWEIENGQLVRMFRFDNYYQTMAFVNALAWISHREDHHPDLEVGYAACRVRYSTHSVGGLSINDFICAQKVSRLT